MAGPKNVELLGDNRQSLRVSGSDIRTSVTLDTSVQRKVSASLTASAATTEPDRIFLNLENVRGVNDATAFSVYLNVPDGEDPAKYPDHLAGSIALFGVRKASIVDDKHAGDGLTFVLEISHVVDALHLAGTLNANEIQVRLVPQNPVPDEAKISIGRISIFRQGQ